MFCVDCNNLNTYKREHSMDSIKKRTDERLDALVKKAKENNNRYSKKMLDDSEISPEVKDIMRELSKCDEVWRKN